jgi:hypothetical protein
VETKCEHTLYHKDKDGRSLGSWSEELVVNAEAGKRIRVACGVCGKFYGYALAKGSKPVAAANTSALPLRGPKEQLNTDLSRESREAASEVLMSIDFQKLRSQIPMALVLEIIGFGARETRGPQRRGPCPIHRSEGENSRSFSVNTSKGVFRCFSCGKHGNQLDLYVAVTGLPLFEAASELCQKAGVPLSYVTKSNP